MSTFRTFRAPDARSALAMVKATMGSEAVIVCTKEVGTGLFRPKEIEVSAALPEPVGPPAPLAAARYLPRPPSPSAEADAPASTPPRRQQPDAEGGSRAASVTGVAGGEELSSELLRLHAALEQMRQELRLMSGQVRLERELQLPAPSAQLMAHLVARGMEEALAGEAVRQATLASAPDASGARLHGALRTALAERVAAGPAPWLPGQGRQILALVGPTGVGKTTTIAKIAARALMESRLKVALVTVDTYRIGASEQVARYGEIMGIPTHVARDRFELWRVIERCATADLVLVDTAGRSISEAVARQAEMLRSVPGISLALVVSACSGARELAAAADRYRPLGPERLIVTKIDEAVGPGSLVSASVRIGRPVVAVTDGQRVPEDLHAFSTAQLVDLVIGRVQSRGSAAEARMGGH